MLSNSKNVLVVGSAGSRKTSLIVESALGIGSTRVLITTFTNENVDQIRSYLILKNGCVPKNITVLSWFRFLLRHGVRPYQNMLSDRSRVRTINTDPLPMPLKFVKRTDVNRYYFTKQTDIYRDRVAEFACHCDDRTKGFVIGRLEKIYSRIFIDEFQDFAGYDFSFVEKLCRSSIAITMACDPRQGTFSTNHSLKNKRFKRAGVMDWIKKLEGLVTIQERNECFRSNQVICDFADQLYPDFSKTVSMNTEITGHDGIFEISEDAVSKYVQEYAPTILRYNVATQTKGLKAINIGSCKGRTYDRVLIFPTGPMSEYVRTKNLAVVGDKAKLYVAVTRAKYSAAFVMKKKPAARKGSRA